MTRRDWTTCLAWLPRPSRWPGVVERLRRIADAVHRYDLPIHVVAAVGAPVELGRVETRRCDMLAGPDWPVLARLARYQLLSRSIPSDTARLILRVPGAADPSLPWFLDRWGSRTISEHHGDEVAERLRMGRGGTALLRAGIEAGGLRILLRGIAGSLGVTPEIARILQRRGPVGLRTGWTGNGIDVAGVSPTGRQRYVGGALELVAVLGNAAPWHGLDRILGGLSAHRGRPVRLHIVGNLQMPVALAPGCDAELVCHGHQSGSMLDGLLARAHLGVGSLAMHRAGLTQACPLKSREYAARGLPFFYAYDDPGLPGDLPWCLRLSGGDGPIPIDELFTFAEGLPEDASDRLRAYAAAHLDWRQVLASMHAQAVDMTS